MIIQICGTNGSGKSTAMRAVMAEGRRCGPVVGPGHKEYGSVYQMPGVPNLTLVMGKYGEAATGGCDRISDVKSIRPVITRWSEEYYHVLFEGIRMMNHTEGVVFSRQHQANFTIVLLRVELEECLEGIRSRQVAAGRDKAVVVQDIRSNITRARNYATKCAMVGAKVIGATRDEAPGKILELLRSAK